MHFLWDPLILDYLSVLKSVVTLKTHTFYTLSPRMIGTNYVGAFVLTKLLLPLLENSPVSSKIVNVTSFTHRAGRTIILILTFFLFKLLSGDPILWIFVLYKIFIRFSLE